MGLKGLFLIILGIALAFVSYFYWDYKKTGGYPKNSDGYYGYSFPLDNGLNNPTDCGLANTENPEQPPVSKEWMEGCLKYFEMNSKK